MELIVLGGLIESGRIFLFIAGLCLSVFVGTLGKRRKIIKLIVWLGIYIACEYFLNTAGILKSPLLFVGSYALGASIGYTLSALVKSIGRKDKKKNK